jgi:phage shock protein A
MATLLERAGALVSANLHWLIDKAMAANSTAMLDAYIRKLGDHKEALEDATATVGAEARGMKRKADEFQAEADEKDEQVNEFLRAGKDNYAEVALAKAKAKKRLADQYRGQWQALQANFNDLMEALGQVDVKLAIAKQERAEVLSLLELAEAKEVAVEAVTSLDDIDKLEDPDISKIAEGIRARLDKAEVRIEMEEEDLEDQMEEFIGQRRDQAELEARKRELGLITEEE